MQADRDTGCLSKSSAFESLMMLAPFPAPLAHRSRHFHLPTIVVFISMSPKVYHWGASFISLGYLSVDSTEERLELLIFPCPSRSPPSSTIVVSFLRDATVSAS